MTLSEKQRLFTRLVGLLIDRAYAEGYELTFGEAYRTKEQAAWNAEKAGTGIVNSLHCKRLAVDFNLFINEQWQTSSEAHRSLGEYWKTLHPDCRWGGDFIRPDGNHYSLTHEGVK